MTKWGRMSLEKINWGTMLLVIPLGHLIVVSVYLWSWFIGFGAHAIILADPRDTFSLSISELVPIYALGFLFPLAMTGLRYTWKHPTAQARLAAISDPVEMTMQAARDRRSKAIILIGGSFIGLQSLAATLDHFMRGYPTTLVAVGAIYFLGFAAVILVWKVGSFSNLQRETLLLVAALFLSAVSNGVSAGQLARHRTFDEAKSSFLLCGENLVIRRLGDHLIGVTPTDRKVITDLECKVVMEIPPHRAQHERRFQWWFPFVRYDPIQSGAR